MDRNPRVLIVVGWDSSNSTDDLDFRNNLSKNDVVAVKLWSLLQGNEELRAVSIFSSVGH